MTREITGISRETDMIVIAHARSGNSGKIFNTIVTVSGGFDQSSHQPTGEAWGAEKTKRPAMNKS